MKTLSDFKRALTLGTKWKNAWYDIDGNMVERPIAEVVQIKTTGVKFKRIQEGVACESWFYFPKASDFAIDNDIAKIYRKDSMNLILKYQLA